MKIEQRIAVIIDSGHGIDTIGKWSPKFHTTTTVGDMEFLAGERFKEHYFNFPTSLLLQTELAKNNIPSRLIRNTEKDMPITERVQIQRYLYNRYKELGFKVVTISVHANAVGDGNSWIDAYGVETFAHVDCKESNKIAGLVQSNTMEVRKRYTPFRHNTDRGVKNANFWHFNRGRRAGFEGLVILPEAEFMTWLPSLKLLTSNQYKEDYVKAIAEAVVEYQGGVVIGNLNSKENRTI